MSIHGALKLRELRLKNVQPTYKNTPIKTRPWSTFEVATLKKGANMGADAVAGLLGRSVTSVRWAAHVHRISLRRLHSYRGRYLGQSPQLSVKEQFQEIKTERLQSLRKGIVEGTTDIRRLEERASREARVAMGAPLCPSCAVNPIEVDTTGYCRDCHTRKLVQAHEFEMDDGPQQELWAARQRKVRQRRREEAEGAE